MDQKALFVASAQEQSGKPYAYGSSDPVVGFDCSGLIAYAASQAKVPGLPRTSGELAQTGKSVTRGELEVGDLVFFDFDAPPTKVQHVGIYVGSGQMINAQSQSPAAVCLANIDSGYWKERVLGYKRIFDEGVGVKGPLIASAQTVVTQAPKPLDGVHM